MKKLFLLRLLALIIMCSSIQGSCPPCPANSANFCNMCSATAVIGNLVVQNSLTFCSGVTGCYCSYNDSLSFNPNETNYNVKNLIGTGGTIISPVGFQPYFNGISGYRDTIVGWPMWQTGVAHPVPIAITAEFEVPEDLDPSVTPTITLHWFNPNTAALNCSGAYVNWLVTADFWDNLETIPLSTGVPTYILSSGDQLLTYAPNLASLTQQQVDVLLTGPAMTPGAYGQVTVTRQAPTGAGHVDSSCTLYLAAIVFKYHKLAQ